ncbi:MAG: YdcF family protein [Bacteroidia bacterium]
MEETPEEISVASEEVTEAVAEVVVIGNSKFQYIRTALKKVLHFLKRLFHWLFLCLGAFLFILLILSFTRVPYDVSAWLAKKSSRYNFKPDAIVFLGGSGMPSEANLIRLYYTAALSEKYPKAEVWIVHPKDTSVIMDMKEELLLHKVDSSHIHIEKLGTNTREQALCLARDAHQLLFRKVVIVTSPENMLRTVKTFRKAGFRNVGGEPAFENAMYADLGFDYRKLGGKKYVPDVSSNLGLRYNFWNYLKLEINCLREFTAIAYYELNGWM